METAAVRVMKEAVRRRLNIWNYFFDFVTYGYGRPGTAENEPHPVTVKSSVMWEPRKVVVCPEKGWPNEEDIVKRLEEWGLRGIDDD